MNSRVKKHQQQLAIINKNKGLKEIKTKQKQKLNLLHSDLSTRSKYLLNKYTFGYELWSNFPADHHGSNVAFPFSLLASDDPVEISAGTV